MVGSTDLQGMTTTMAAADFGHSRQVHQLVVLAWPSDEIQHSGDPCSESWIVVEGEEGGRCALKHQGGNALYVHESGRRTIALICSALAGSQCRRLRIECVDLVAELDEVRVAQGADAARAKLLRRD